MYGVFSCIPEPVSDAAVC